MLELMKEDAVCPQRVTARVLSPQLLPGTKLVCASSSTWAECAPFKIKESGFLQLWLLKVNERDETSLPELRQCKQGISLSSWKEGKNLTKGKQQTDDGTKK